MYDQKESHDVLLKLTTCKSTFHFWHSRHSDTARVDGGHLLTFRLHLAHHTRGRARIEEVTVESILVE